MFSLKDNIELDKPIKSDPNSARCNLHMNIEFSNVNGSKISRRARLLFIFFFVFIIIFFGVVLGKIQILNGEIQTLQLLKGEVQALQLLKGEVDTLQVLKKKVQALQMQMNFLLLKSKYDNQVTNRVRIRRSNYDQESISSIKSSIHELSNLSEVRNDQNYSITSLESYFNQAIPSVPNPMDQNSKNSLEIDASSILNNVTTLSIRYKNNSIVDLNEKQNLPIRARTIPINETQNRIMMKSEKNRNDTLNLWKEPRARRLRRSEGRGKKRQQKNRGRPNRSRKRLAPLLTMFIGAVPEQHITHQVYIGPWIKNNENNSQYDFSNVRLVEDNMSIEITISGLYMLSVQIVYFGESTNHSYWILLSSEGTTEKLSTCITAFSSSCYTHVTRYLQKDDRLRIQQQERNRLINLRKGHSFIQLLLLDNDTQQKHST